jgi:flagellar hook-associated protein 2
VSDTTILTATAGANATSGTHSVVVTGLATTSSYYTDRKATATTPFQQGTFTLQVGSAAPVTVTVDETNNTMEGLASTLNGLNANVQAGTITDSLGTRLNIISTSSGEVGDITISDDTVGLGFTKGAAGTNASLVFDGVPVSSASNTVDGIIPGLTLQLSALSSSATTLSINPDTSAARQAISDFVASYNEALGSITSQFQYDSASKSAGILAGDSTLQLVQQSLLSQISTSNSSNVSIKTLSSLGITQANDGTLTIDSAQLDQVLAGNFDEAKTFFQDSSGGLATRLKTVMDGLTDSTNGPINLEITGLTNSSNEIGKLVDDFETQLAIRQEHLIRQYSQVDATLRQLPLLLSQISGQIKGISG